MPLKRLLSFQLHQLEAIVSETWTALRGQSHFEGVPPLQPSAGLVCEALLDRSFTLATHVLTGVPLPDVVRRMQEEVAAARDYYAAEGWLEDPRSYHQAPPALDASEQVMRRALPSPRRFDHLRFASGWAPRPEEPGHERWRAHEGNATGHVYLLEHPEPRPWLVCVHGFSMGSPLVNFTGFDVGLLHDELGLNIAMPVLPFHGPRATAWLSGGELLRPDFLQMVHLFACAAWEVRSLLAWLRGRGAASQGVGLYGISLGGYVSSLVAGLESQLDCVIAGIPASNFPGLARDNEPWIMRRYDDDAQIDWAPIRAMNHVVSPLALETATPRERLFIYAGLADRLVRPDQPRALWRHWGEPDIHWYAGGHVLGVRNRSVAPYVARSLERAGMARISGELDARLARAEAGSPQPRAPSWQRA